MEHYLDNSATTVVSKNAAAKALEIMTSVYGNPSSLHLKGIEAEHQLSRARKSVAKATGAVSDEVYFTSGGTEANNTALFGAALAKKRTANRIVISSVEHSSIIEAAKYLEDNGYEVVRVNPQKDGTVHAEDILSAVNDKTSIVSVMSVNNETGAIMPCKEIFSAVKNINKNILCHTDAVQAFGKIKLNFKSMGADLMSVSGHKVFAPKGVGALIVKKGVRIIAHQYGGEQEKKLRPGTENISSICALGVACDEFDIDKNFEYVKELNNYAKTELNKIDGVVFNSTENALAYVLNISVGNVRSETMLHFLEQREVYVSSGSACAKGKPSHVLSSMGISKNRADSAIRISFSKHNTKDDIDALCKGIGDGLKMLAHR